MPTSHSMLFGVAAPLFLSTALAMPADAQGALSDPDGVARGPVSAKAGEGGTVGNMNLSVSSATADGPRHDPAAASPTPRQRDLGVSP